MTAIRRHSMVAIRLLGVGLLFAVGFPQHGVSAAPARPDAAPIVAADRATGTLAQAEPRRAGAGGAIGSAESPRLRALRTQETDLFKNLPDLAPNAPAIAGRAAAEGTPAPREIATTEADDKAFFANLHMPEIPVRAHERVKQYLEYFTQNSDGRRIFRTWLKRSGRYSKTVTGSLRELMLPQDLQAVVFVESGFSPKAVSTAGAVGLWQFMAETARVYGLAVENDLDERRSIDRSSHAAVRLLADMRDRFGSWELALAAYNMGYKALVDRIKDVSTNDFWTLSEIDGVLPRETALYVPKVLATAVILRNLDRFGFDDTRVDPPVASADLDVPAGTNLALVARAAGTNVKMLRELNPELLTDTIPDRGRSYAVHVPSSGMARAQAMLPRLLDQRDRDGLDAVANDDFDWGRDDLPRGQRAPRRRGYDPYADSDDAPRRPAPRRGAYGALGGDDEGGRVGDSNGRNVILYRVGESENVGVIARTFGTTTGQIIEDNYLDPGGKLQKGMLLIVEVSPKSMNRIMKKRASSRLEDGAPPEKARAEGSDDDGASPAPKREQKRSMTDDAARAARLAEDEKG